MRSQCRWRCPQSQRYADARTGSSKCCNVLTVKPAGRGVFRVSSFRLVFFLCIFHRSRDCAQKGPIITSTPQTAASMTNVGRVYCPLLVLVVHIPGCLRRQSRLCAAPLDSSRRSQAAGGGMVDWQDVQLCQWTRVRPAVGYLHIYPNRVIRHRNLPQFAFRRRSVINCDYVLRALAARPAALDPWAVLGGI